LTADLRHLARHQVTGLAAQFLLGMAVNLLGLPSQAKGAAHTATTVSLAAHVLITLGLLAGVVMIIRATGRPQAPSRQLAIGGAIAIAATALRERDRDRWAQERSILSVLTATGLLLAFGVVALRNQRKELELERELAIAALRDEQNERLASATRAAALGTLAIGVAQEVSTPLGVIAGRAEQLLPKVRDDQRAHAAVQGILDQTHRISQVIRGLLGLARGGRVSADHLSAVRLVQGARVLVEHRFDKAGIHLSIEVPENLPTITGDGRLIESALVNLLLNACDACTLGGHVRLSVEAHESAVRFSVVDDGSGISAQHAEKVLEPFFTTKANGEGTGLGLAITNEIVKSHFGTLSLTARFPRGTSAIVEIPADRASLGT